MPSSPIYGSYGTETKYLLLLYMFPARGASITHTYIVLAERTTIDGYHYNDRARVTSTLARTSCSADIGIRGRRRVAILRSRTVPKMSWEVFFVTDPSWESIFVVVWTQVQRRRCRSDVSRPHRQRPSCRHAVSLQYSCKSRYTSEMGNQAITTANSTASATWR